MFAKIKKLPAEVKIYCVAIALTAIAGAIGFDLVSNYLADAYHSNAIERGIIELPRELPGILCVFIISLFAYAGDVRISAAAQFLSSAGLIVLAFVTPQFNIMLIFLFIISLGNHLFMPLRDSIALSLSSKNKVGRSLGNYKALFTAFLMLGSTIAFFTFRYGIFSFKTDLKLSFLVAAILQFTAGLFLIWLRIRINAPIIQDHKVKFIFRKEYKFYYGLTILYGAQKQIMIVYGPWVLIEILSKGAATISMMNIIGCLIGIFFIPTVGKFIDKYGVKKMLYFDALSFIFVYLSYGLLCSGFNSGSLLLVGIPVLLTYFVFIFDKMSMQMGMIRTIYLKNILVKQTDLVPTLTMGLSLDHCISIPVAMFSGYIWFHFGPQYIFYIAATLSLFNLLIATKVKVDEQKV